MSEEQRFVNESIQEEWSRQSGARGLLTGIHLTTRRLISCVLAFGVIGLAASPLSLAAGPSVDADHAQWRDTMNNVKTPQVGCFQATFPSTQWESVSCRRLTKHSHPIPRITKFGQPQTTGNGNDYALVATGLITKTIGSFPTVSGVVTESNVGVPAFQNGGILGANEYTLQINTNANATTSACSGGNAGCKVWQQFIYATDYETKGSAAVFIQYWLLDYGSSCPSGYKASSPGSNCYKNSISYVAAPDVTVTSLGNVMMTGSVVPGGNDTVTFTDGSTAYSLSMTDSVLQIGTVWHESEFNVVGDTEGSEAVFNQGTAITVKVAALDGSNAKPTCASNAGTTGETNNLTLGSCTAAAGTMPSIQFSETWSGNTDSPTMIEGKHIIYVEGYGASTYTGFDITIGSISPTTTSSGLTYQGIFDVAAPQGAESAQVVLSGFTSDPGKEWLGSVTALGVKEVAASATYEYLSGQASWVWTNTKFGFTGSGTTTVQITHQ